MNLQEKYNNFFNALTICVDEYENRIPCGRIYDLHPGEGVCFRGTIELLQSIEDALEEMKCPQSFTGKRMFWPEVNKTKPETISEGIRAGMVGTFSLRILFRQNASWQGGVAWIEGKAEQSFRSVLELLLLMDSALNSSTRNSKKIENDSKTNKEGDKNE